MKILVTGFKPFLGHDQNPSQRLAHDLAAQFSEVVSLILPVEFGRAFEVLDHHLQTNRYDYVLMLGQAAGRPQISLEKIGLNWIETRNADEAGVRPVAGPIVKGADLAYMTSFDVDGLYAKLAHEKQPVHVSFSAGTFVCNELYYRMLQKHREVKSLFIHVPLLPEQLREGMTFSLDYSTQYATLKKVVQTLI